MLVRVNNVRTSRNTSLSSHSLLQIICPRYLNSSTNFSSMPLSLKEGNADATAFLLSLSGNIAITYHDMIFIHLLTAQQLAYNKAEQ